MSLTRIQSIKQDLEEILEEVIESTQQHETDEKAKQHIAQLYRENQQEPRSPKKLMINMIYNQFHAPNDDHYLPDHVYNMPFKELQDRFKELKEERGVKSYHIFDKKETIGEVVNQTQKRFMETTKSVKETTMKKIQDFLYEEYQIRIGYRVLPASDAEQHDALHTESDTLHPHHQQE